MWASRLFTDIREPQVRLNLLNISKLLPRIFGAHAWWHNNVIANRPVDRRNDTLLVTSLKRINHPQHFCRVATSASRVVHLESDLLGGVDDEDGADSEGNSLLLDVVKVILRDHVVEESDLAVGVGDDGELDGCILRLIDVVDPLVVRAEVVGALTVISFDLLEDEVLY